VEKPRKLKLLLNIVLAAIFLAGIAYATIKYGPYLTKLASKPQQLKDALNSFGWKGVLVFILLQILQVVVAAIPGEFVQLAGGYLYGSWLGTLYSLMGIITGSVIVFFIARFLGYPIVRAFVSQKNLDKFNFMMNSNKSEVAMFLLFLIPGIPKDILTYIAGLTPIKPLRFFIIITIGRLPALFGSSVIGSSTQKGDYLLVVILSAAALVLFTAGLLLKDKIIDKLYEATQNRENKNNL
jgi:uncharacterized membrane protein YdjX (TVP38/TMEM64 family)